MSFRIELQQPVAIKVSGTQGTVIGRAEYTYANPSYLVRYADKQGTPREAWWSDEALEPVAQA